MVSSNPVLSVGHVEYHAGILRHAGDSDGDLLEILGVVDHYTMLNTLSDAMQIESDIRPT